MENQAIEAIAKEVKERMTAIGDDTEAIKEAVSDKALEAKIKAQFDLIVEDKEFTRKLRFAADPKLSGSKYAGLGVGDIEMLHHILTSAQAIGRSKGPSEELQNAFTACSEGRYSDAVSAKAVDVHTAEEMLVSGRLDTQGFNRALAGIENVYGRAMDTAETGYGLELIGAQYASDLWAGAQTMSRVSALIPTFQMTAPTAYLPVEADIPEMTFVSENTGATDSAYGTTKTGSNVVQVDAKKFIIHQVWSGEMEEDSLIGFLPFLRGQAQRSIAHYSDSLVLNGDTTNAGTGNINLDDADPADTKHYLAYDGIRHVGLVDNTGNGTDHSNASITYDAMVNLRKLGLDATYFHDWGHPTNPSDFVFVVNPELGDELSKLDEVLTVDKYGSAATILTGEIANIGRNPVVGSVAVSKTEADGFVSTTPGNNLRHQCVAFNRRGFVTGIRRQLKVETERLPGRDQNRIVYSLRNGFGRFSPTGAASGIEAATVLYNIAA